MHDKLKIPCTCELPSGHDLHEHHAHASGAFWENYTLYIE